MAGLTVGDGLGLPLEWIEGSVFTSVLLARHHPWVRRRWRPGIRTRRPLRSAPYGMRCACRRGPDDDDLDLPGVAIISSGPRFRESTSQPDSSRRFWPCSHWALGRVPSGNGSPRTRPARRRTRQKATEPRPSLGSRSSGPASSVSGRVPCSICRASSSTLCRALTARAVPGTTPQVRPRVRVLLEQSRDHHDVLGESVVEVHDVLERSHDSGASDRGCDVSGQGAPPGSLDVDLGTDVPDLITPSSEKSLAIAARACLDVDTICTG